MNVRLSLFIIFLAAVFLASGCAHKETGTPSAQDMFKEASELAKKDKVEKAAEKFMEVRTYYPGDELARKSLLATGELYYDNELYESALQSYEEFRLLYPTDPDAGYCLYKIALSHFKQMSTYDRDQTQTVKTIQSLDNFLTSYPNSPYKQGAKDLLAEARSVLARHYVYIGKFYLKKKDYVGACNRFEYVKQQYQDVSLEEDIDSLISKSCPKVEPPQAASPLPPQAPERQ